MQPSNPPKVTVLAHAGRLVMIPHEPKSRIDDGWWPVDDRGKLGSVVENSDRDLACSQEALDLMQTVRRNRDAVGDLGWWPCADGNYAFSWFGPLYRIIDPRNAEGDRDFRVRPEHCTIVPNELPEDVRAAVDAAIEAGAPLWREPFRVEYGA